MIRLFAVLVIPGVIAGCSSNSASSAGAPLDAGTDAAADASEGPSVAESCTAICAKKVAAACAKDRPATDCSASCLAGYTAPPGDPSCLAEYAVDAACIARGQVVCSVDGESTPVAICGNEQRALSACLVPGADAGN